MKTIEVVLVPAYMGRNVDHLYEHCPTLARQRGQPVFCQHGGPVVGTKCRGWVDPLGSDICGWCQWLWRRRHRAGKVAA